MQAMLTILYGENVVKSRDTLTSLLAKAKQENKVITRLEAKTLTESSLQEALSSQELFGGDKVVVIEELHSLPVSARKKALLKLLSDQANGTTGSTTDVIIWEKRSLTKTMLKPFVDTKTSPTKVSLTKALEFKSSNHLFAWLDLLGNPQHAPAKKLGLLHEAITTDGEHFCFLMLARQLRLLIAAKEGTTIAGPPFVVSKLQNQARNFELNTLLTLHQKLLTIDEAQKTSHNAFTLAQELNMITLGL
jgi:DNA polymerase III delta subunit